MRPAGKFDATSLHAVRGLERDPEGCLRVDVERVVDGRSRLSPEYRRLLPQTADRTVSSSGAR
jgi:hypothetical protein